jgi:hypothetical protein
MGAHLRRHLVQPLGGAAGGLDLELGAREDLDELPERFGLPMDDERAIT